MDTELYKVVGHEYYAGADGGHVLVSNKYKTLSGAKRWLDGAPGVVTTYEVRENLASGFTYTKAIHRTVV